MPNFIISGGPGAGKSTLLNALRAEGFYCSDEVSRRLIQEQVALDSQCLPWLDLGCFARQALVRMVAEYVNAPSGVAFFDRGIPDSIAYLQRANWPVDPYFYAVARQYPYQPLVFMAPPWEVIYVNDSERWQTFAEATALHDVLVTVYESLNYRLIELPRAAVADRVRFVQHILQTHTPLLYQEPRTQTTHPQTEWATFCQNR